MDDQSILDLYFSRSEEAIARTDQKYGRYCYAIAYNILTNREDAEESVSDTYLTAWKSIPPRRPSVLATFLGKITRHIAIDRWRARSAAQALGMTGFVQNEADGTVYLEAQGSPAAHDRLLTARYEGRYIRIERLESRKLPTVAEERSFRVRE